MTPIFVDKQPFSWNQGQALDLFTIYDMVLDCHPGNHPVSPLMITGIMYEETAFCNRVQQTTNGKGPAVGFGQMQIYDPEKKVFWDWMGYNNTSETRAESLSSLPSGFSETTSFPWT